MKGLQWQCESCFSDEDASRRAVSLPPVKIFSKGGVDKSDVWMYTCIQIRKNTDLNVENPL